MEMIIDSAEYLKLATAAHSSGALSAEGLQVILDRIADQEAWEKEQAGMKESCPNGYK